MHPLVEARAVVVGAELVARERKVREGVRTVDEHLDAMRLRQLDDLAHRRDVARQEADVHDLDHARRRRDRRRDLIDVRLHALDRRLDLHPLEHDAVAALALLPRVLHARIVLRREDHFVAALEIEPEDHRLVRLGRVARDRHLFRIAAEVLREIAAHRLDARLEHAPHVFRRQLVRESEISNHLLEHVRRRGTAAAVVQIDHRAIEIERALDLAPVRLVLGHRGGRESLGDRFGAEELLERGLAHDGKRHACAEHRGDERASSCHANRFGPNRGGVKSPRPGGPAGARSRRPAGLP